MYVKEELFSKFFMQLRVLSGDKSYLWTSFLPGVGEGDTFTKGNWYPDFRQKGGEQRANCLHLKIIFMWKWYILGWHTLIPFTMVSSGFAKKLERPAILVRIVWLEKDRYQRYLAKKLWQRPWWATEVSLKYEWWSHLTPGSKTLASYL